MLILPTCRAKDVSVDMWLQDLNDAIIKAVGLDQLGRELDLDAQDLLEEERELLQVGLPLPFRGPTCRCPA